MSDQQRSTSKSQVNNTASGASELTRPDVVAIMARIRAEVALEIKKSGTAMPKYLPPPAKLADGSLSPVLYAEELKYLNAHWNEWAEPTPVSSHRRLLGRVIVRCKQKLRHYITESLLKSYFDREREFQMNLVRYLNATARYIDARDAEIFWQLVHKVDSDITTVNERTDRLFDESLHHTDNRVDELTRVIPR
jgi:hypothetical protein